ncbi:MAG: hypothetical protein JO265_08395 [Acidimicrobiia bacterium]|nr:hypothetical protein [Acidimicrobiia bacterium]
MRTRSPRAAARAATAAAAATLAGVAVLASSPATAAGANFLTRHHTISLVGSTAPVAPTPTPGLGDLNPYGVAVVHRSVGKLVAGDILVSNFNNSQGAGNQQGRGSTIVQVSPGGGAPSTFADLANADPAQGVGLTTALAILPRGFVAVGSLPTSDGTSGSARAGDLFILDANGNLVKTIAGSNAGPINGPWDATAVNDGDRATLFVTNVLNGTVANSPNTVNNGTVVRLVLSFARNAPEVLSTTVVASGFPERTDTAALVVGPTGVGVSGDRLYVADTVGNRIAAVPDALSRRTSGGTGTTVSLNGSLNGPLGLTVAPNGDILTVNAGDGNAVETTPRGVQETTLLLDNTGSPPGAGANFGLALIPDGAGLYVVDDNANVLNKVA